MLVGFLWVGLSRDPHEVPSPLVDKPAPAFSLAQLDDPAKKLGPADLKGQVWLLNVWASWCVSCRVEHPLLVSSRRRTSFRSSASITRTRRHWAARGSRKTAIRISVSVVDADGRVGIDWGVYGVPETFVVDKNGVIRYKQIGPITPESLQQKILPLVRELQKS